MNKKTITIIVVFFVVLVAGMFTFAFIKKAEITEESLVPIESPQPDIQYSSISRIEGKHYYIDGVHTVVGEIPMPTPCDLLEADAVVAESFPEQITLQFDVINNSESCIQQITPQRYKVSATASEDASFSANFMGRRVDFNLIPAAPSETPDTYEVFIKG